MESNLQYAEKDYWNNRFETEKNFEWLADFESFEHLILPYIRPEDRILHIGCGTSQLSQRLYERGFSKITNVDYSEVLVKKGEGEEPNLHWICDNIKSLQSIADNSYDVVLEKATIEALLVAEKSPWDPSDEALDMLDAVYAAIHRVLTPKGLFMSISFTQPHFRVPALMRRSDWGITVETFGDTFHYFFYVMVKGETTLENVQRKYGSIAKAWLQKRKKIA